MVSSTNHIYPPCTWRCHGETNALSMATVCTGAPGMKSWRLESVESWCPNLSNPPIMPATQMQKTRQVNVFGASRGLFVFPRVKFSLYHNRLENPAWRFDRTGEDMGEKTMQNQVTKYISSWAKGVASKHKNDCCQVTNPEWFLRTEQTCFRTSSIWCKQTLSCISIHVVDFESAYFFQNMFWFVDAVSGSQTKGGKKDFWSWWKTCPNSFAGAAGCKNKFV